MGSDTDSRVEYWIGLAEYDCKTAEVMLRGRRFLYVGFMCHQVAEKSLKACTWHFRETEPEFTHSLSRLLETSGINSELPDDLIKLLDELEPLNIEARYPTQKEKLLQSLTRQRCRRLVARTKGFLEWTKTQLA